jgi:putative addiction module killer protein
MEYIVHEYIHFDGRSPYAIWFGTLDPIAASKVTVAILRLTQGNTSNLKWFKGIAEYKIDFGPGYRIYLAKDNDIFLILLGGGTKKTQAKDIDKALTLWHEYKIRKKQERH